MAEKHYLPAIPLRGGVVFPGTTTTITIGRARSLAAAQAAIQGDGEILILVQYDADVEEPESDDLAPVGILGTVRDVMRTPHVGVQMLVELHRRVQFEGLAQTQPYMTGGYSEMEAPDESEDDGETASAELIAYLEQYAEVLGEVNRQVMISLRNQTSAGDLADYAAGLLNLP